MQIWSRVWKCVNFVTRKCSNCHKHYDWDCPRRRTHVQGSLKSPPPLLAVVIDDCSTVGPSTQFNASLSFITQDLLFFKKFCKSLTISKNCLSTIKKCLQKFLADIYNKKWKYNRYYLLMTIRRSESPENDMLFTLNSLDISPQLKG